MKHTYIYNICWEDPRIDASLLNLTHTDNIFMISSAGCNLLHYLLQSPVSIVACDINPFQLHLLELKLAQLRDPLLTYYEWWQIWGLSDVAVSVRVWSRIRHTVSADARAFWDCRIVPIFSSHYSTSGSAGTLVRHVLPLLMLGLGSSLKKLRHMASQPHAVFKDWLLSSRFLQRFAACVGHAVSVPFVCTMFGIPPRQTNHCAFLKTHAWWLDVFKRIFVDDENVMTDNYFYYFYLFGTFSETCRPSILQTENFDKLKQNAHRVQFHNLPVWEALRQYPDAHFSKFVLLDHQDWLTNEQIQNEWHVIFQKACPNATVLWRSIHTCMQSQYPFFATIRNIITDKSSQCYPLDRVKMYPGTFTATLPDKLYIPAIELQLSKPVGVLSQLSCVASMLTYPLKSVLCPPESQQESMQRFYAGQARAYDTVRESMLPARRALISLMAPFRRDGLTWLDVGGGTGRNVRYLRGQLAHFAKIVIVDLCPALLEAGQEAAVDGLDECERRKIMWLCMDATSSDFLQRVHDATGVRMFDRVTFSYSLSMIPDWRAAVRNATAMCDGRMIVADFDTFSEEGVGIRDWILSKWFAQDGVHISRERRRWLSEVFDGAYVRRWVQEGIVRGIGLPHYVLAAELEAEKTVCGDAVEGGMSGLNVRMQ